MKSKLFNYIVLIFNFNIGQVVSTNYVGSRNAETKTVKFMRMNIHRVVQK